MFMTKNKKPSFTSRRTRSSLQTSSKQVGNLYFFTRSRRLQTKSLMSILGLGGRKEVVLLFLYQGWQNTAVPGASQRWLPYGTQQVQKQRRKPVSASIPGRKPVQIHEHMNTTDPLFPPQSRPPSRGTVLL